MPPFSGILLAFLSGSYLPTDLFSWIAASQVCDMHHCLITWKSLFSTKKSKSTGSTQIIPYCLTNLKTRNHNEQKNMFWKKSLNTLFIHSLKWAQGTEYSVLCKWMFGFKHLNSLTELNGTTQPLKFKHLNLRKCFPGTLVVQWQDSQLLANTTGQNTLPFFFFFFLSHFSWGRKSAEISKLKYFD